MGVGVNHHEWMAWRRERLGIPPDRLAERLGVPPSVLIGWEAGKASEKPHSWERAIEECERELLRDLLARYPDVAAEANGVCSSE